MTSASDTGPQSTEAASPHRPKPFGRRLAAVVFTASTCMASMAILPASAHAQQRSTVGAPVATAAPVGSSLTITAFCAHFSPSTISSIVGAKVVLVRGVIETGSWECIFAGLREVIISREPSVPAGELSTLAKAEAVFKAKSPKGAKITFTALPSLGKTAFSWSYVDNGGLLVGVGNNAGKTAWGAVLGAGVAIMGSAAPHVPAVERLIKLDMDAPS